MRGGVRTARSRCWGGRRSVRTAGKSGLAIVALMMLSVGSGLAVQQSAQQSADPGAPAAQEQATPKPAVPVRVRVSQGVTQGLIIKRVQPKYPGKARENGIQGQVVLRAVINKQGDIADLAVVSGDPLLAKSAVKAVKQWKYKPYLLLGNPVEVDTEILVNFTLSGN
jgi:TonB family protein